MRAAVDCGFDVWINLTFRWEGIDAPEMSTEEGKIAKAVLLERLPEGSLCTIRTTKLRKEKYGRYLATFIAPDGTNLNQWLVKEGFAKPYMVIKKDTPDA